MKSEFRTTRRRVLHLLAAVCGAVSINIPVMAASRGTRLPDAGIARAIDVLISHRESAAVIGAVYLRRFEQERSVEVLERKLRESIGDNASPLDEYTLLHRIGADFERGEIVNLQGWLLSQTEARLCALCARYDNPDAHRKFG